MKRVIPEYSSLVDIIEDAIIKEKDAWRFYTEAAEMAPTDDIREFLLEMAAMEKEHVTLLTNKLETLRSDNTVMEGILSSYNPEAEPDSDS
ncbi:MAG: hypothetical protein KFH87_05280 [Bacteroidetes bacterium]|nr:hypothetical protein [Bacteroidota bacterium]